MAPPARQVSISTFGQAGAGPRAPDDAGRSGRALDAVVAVKQDGAASARVSSSTSQERVGEAASGAILHRRSLPLWSMYEKKDNPILARAVSAHRAPAVRWVGAGATTTTTTTAGIVRRLLVTHRVTHLVHHPSSSGAAAQRGANDAVRR